MSVTENMKEVADLIRKYNDIELNRKIVNLEGEVLDLTRDKRRLEARVEELEATLKLRRTLAFKEPFYWADGDRTPFCPSCWEAGDKAVHVTFGHDNEEETRWDCPSCTHMYLVRKGSHFRATNY